MQKFYSYPLHFILLFLSIANCVWAQSCPELTDGTKSTGGDLGYKSRGDRCEGLVTDTRSAGANFELVSFTKGEVNFFNSTDEEIIISRPDQASFWVNICGRSFNLSKKYRLDWSINKEQKKVIPVRDVILRAGIQKDNLGICGQRKVDSRVLYYPLEVMSKKISTRKLSNGYNIVLIKNTTINSLSYRFGKFNNGEVSALTASTAVPLQSILGDKISIDIPINRFSKGDYVLRVAYILGSEKPEETDFVIQIP